MAKESKASPTLPLPPPKSVSVEEFTEAVFRGVLRAIQVGSEAQAGINRPGNIQKPGHILYGIIYMPEGGEFQVQSIAPGKQTE